MQSLSHPPGAHPASDCVRRARRTDEEHPWLLDSLVAVLVLLFGLWTVRAGVPSDVFGRRVTSVPVAVVVATAMAQTLPLAWRRKAPLAVFWVVLAACLVQVSLRLALRTDISLMIALYGLVRYAPVLRRSVLMLAGAGTLTAVVLAVFRVPHLRHNTPFVLFFLCCAAAASAGLGLAGRARQAQLVAMSERADRLETERDQRTRIATATERARVSREMHDIVGHNLAVIIGLADGGAALAPVNQERAAEALRLIAATGRQALSELRFTLGALREHQPGTGGGPDLRPQPGAADLPALLDRTRAAGPQVTYTTSGNLAALTPGLQLTIYRIAQESLTNVLRHAGTDTTVQVTLHVSTSASQVRIAVEDTGPPGQPAGQRARTDEERDGQGLTGIRERANLLGGTAQAGPRPGGGWAVHVVLPMLPVPAVSSAPTTPADREQP